MWDSLLGEWALRPGNKPQDVSVRVDLEENSATVTFTVTFTLFDEKGRFYLGSGDYIVKRSEKYYLVNEDDNYEEELTPEEAKKLIEDVLSEEVERGLLP
jgi:hypothetical protein